MEFRTCCRASLRWRNGARAAPSFRCSRNRRPAAVLGVRADRASATAVRACALPGSRAGAAVSVPSGDRRVALTCHRRQAMHDTRGSRPGRCIYGKLDLPADAPAGMRDPASIAGASARNHPHRRAGDTVLSIATLLDGVRAGRADSADVHRKRGGVRRHLKTSACARAFAARAPPDGACIDAMGVTRSSTHVEHDPLGVAHFAIPRRRRSCFNVRRCRNERSVYASANLVAPDSRVAYRSCRLRTRDVSDPAALTCGFDALDGRPAIA